MTKSFGWKKDKFDERDYIFKPKVVKLPDKVSLEGWCPSVRDQGRLGSCTGFGIGGNLTALAKQQSAYTEWFSPTWVYNGGRLYGNTLNWDSGAYPRDCLEFLVDNGSLLEHFRPYSDMLDISNPTTWSCAKEAKNYPVLSYTRITGDEFSVCQSLAEGHLVSLGCPWFNSWMYTDSDGKLPEIYDSLAGGHETLLYGYDLVDKVFYGQNSWGIEWGKDGRFLMPFSAWQEFKKWGGWDAHVISVNWSSTPTPIPKKSGILKILLYIAAGIAVLATIISVFAK